MIHDENRKSVENDVYMFIAILYRILPSDLSWVLLERITIIDLKQINIGLSDVQANIEVRLLCSAYPNAS